MKVRIKRIPKRKKSTRTEREDAKRFATNVSTGLLIIGAIIGLVTVANRWARKEETRSFRIIGRSILDSAEIMRAAAIPDSIPFQQLDLASIEHHVLTHPFISRASVYRGENGTVILDIAERAPVAIALIGGEPLYLDSLGIPLPYRFSSAGFDLPVISGIERTVDTSASRPGAPRPATVTDTVRTREALGVLAALRSYDDGLYRQISEIRREPWGEYTLLTVDGAVPVQAGYPAEIPSRLGKLDRFMTSVLAAKGVQKAASIDLRWKGQVVVRWRQDEVIPRPQA